MEMFARTTLIIMILVETCSNLGEACAVSISYKGNRVKFLPILLNETDTTFKCTATNCNKTSQMTWSYKSSTYYESASFSSCSVNNKGCTLTSTHDIALSLPNRNDENEQRLSCSVWSSKALVTISIQYEPHMTIEPSDPSGKIIVYDGQRTRNITCRTLKSNPNVTSHLWYKEGRFLQDGEVLTLTNIEISDIGMYYCIGTNPVGNSSNATFILDVQYMSTVHDLSDVIMVEDDRRTVNCPVTEGNPSPKIYWTKGSSTVGSNQFLHVRKRTDAGTYVCHAETTFTPTGQLSFTRDVNKSMVVDVLYPPDISFTPGTLTLLENKNNSLVCRADGNPNNSTFLEWHYEVGDAMWNMTGTYEAPNRNVLYFVNPDYRHYGKYTCRATNGIKNIVMEKTIDVNVKTYPHKINKGDVTVSKGSVTRRQLSVHVLSFGSVPSVTWLRLPDISIARDLRMNTTHHELNFHGTKINMTTYRSAIMADISPQESATFVAVVGNSMGQTVFQINVPTQDASEPLGVETIASIALGSLLTLSFIVIGVLVFLLRRRSAPPSVEYLDRIYKTRNRETVNITYGMNPVDIHGDQRSCVEDTARKEVAEDTSSHQNGKSDQDYESPMSGSTSIHQYLNLSRHGYTNLEIGNKDGRKIGKKEDGISENHCGGSHRMLSYENTELESKAPTTNGTTYENIESDPDADYENQDLRKKKKRK